MFKLLLLTLFLTLTSTSIFDCLPHDVTYVGYMESSGGYIDDMAKATAMMSFQINDIVGIEVDWYDPQFNDYEFLVERAIYTETLEIDYIYFYTDGDNVLAYVLDTTELGSDSNEHGCGAYLVEDVEWLTEEIND